MKKVKIFSFFILIVPLTIFPQKNYEKLSRLFNYESQIADIENQLKAFSDFAPEKIPGFESLEKINQLVEKLDFSKRKFDLLIKEYNIIEDDLFPLAIELSKKNPELSQDIIKFLTNFYGRGKYSIYELQKRINNLGLYIERIEREIENLENISFKTLKIRRQEESEKIKNQSLLSALSQRIEILKNENDELKRLLSEEEKILVKLEEKKKRQETKIEEKLREADELLKKSKNSSSKVERLVNLILSKVRKIRVMGLEHPRLSSAKALIYIEKTKIENIKKRIRKNEKDIALLKTTYKRELKKKILKGFLIVLIAIIVVLLVLRMTKKLGEKFIEKLDKTEKLDSEQKKRYKTIFSILQTILKITLWVLAVIWVLGELNIDYAPFLVAAGGASLAIGFGAQSLVKDIVSGFFILLEDQLSIGDVVEVNGKIGTVEKINLRTIWLRSFDGSLHIIPNGTISKISNLTENWARAVLKIGVSYNDDMEKVISVLNRVGEEMWSDPEWKEKLLEKPQCLGVDSFEDSSVVYLMIAKTKAGAQWSTARELRKRIKDAFDKEGIEIPYPYLNIVNREK